MLYVYFISIMQLIVKEFLYNLQTLRMKVFFLIKTGGSDFPILHKFSGFLPISHSVRVSSLLMSNIEYIFGTENRQDDVWYNISTKYQKAINQTIVYHIDMIKIIIF